MKARSSWLFSRSGCPAGAGVSAFAPLRAAAGRLTSALHAGRLRRVRSLALVDVRRQGARAVTDPTAGGGFARRFVGAGAAIALGAAVLAGGAPDAGAATLTFAFSDDGTNSTVAVSGSVDLSGGTKGLDLGSVSLSALRIGYVNPHFDQATFSNTVAFNDGVSVGVFTSDYVGWKITVEGLDSYEGDARIDNIASYYSDMYFAVFATTDTKCACVSVDTSRVNDGVYDPTGSEITFAGTLLDVLGDDEFHIEYAFGGNRVVFRAGPLGPSPEAERRALKHALAAVAQATLAGAVDTIGQRFEAAPGARELTLAGRRFGGAPGTPTTAATDANRWDWALGIGGLATARGEAASGSALLRGSGFVLPLAAAADGSGGTSGVAWTLWGRGDWRAFEGQKDGDSWDGMQRTGWLGVDGRLDSRTMAGLAVSRGESETDYRLDEFEGRLDASLTALWPYLQVTTGVGGSLRLVFGAGAGDIRHRRFDGEEEKEDLSLLAGSVSGRVPLARRGGVSLSALAGASLSQIEADGSSSTSSVGGLTAKSWRLRGGLEVERDGMAFSPASDWSLRPRGSLELRQDGGDGVTGAGVEVAGGLRLSSPGDRFGIDASGRWLALHSEDGTEEWGASLEARLAPGADGRGLSLALGPAWGRHGNAALASERLFERTRSAVKQRPSFTARAGYGFEAAGGLLKPFADVAFGGESDTQRYRTGIGFARSGIDAALTAGRRGGGDSDSRLGLDLQLRY